MYKLGDKFRLVLMHLVIALDWKDTNIPLACQLHFDYDEYPARTLSVVMSKKWENNRIKS